MRPVNSDLRQKFETNLQTKANRADPEAIVWINRPTTALTDSEFLEETAVSSISSLMACDVALRRTRAANEPDRAYVAFVADGTAGVKSAALTQKIEDMVWTEEGFSVAAEDVAIAFDGNMPRSASGTAEFITDERPWVFWVKSGVLKGRILGLLGDVELASANATKVTAIRATKGGSIDFGLLVFFLLNGAIYYRQLIGGEWMDAEPVTFGPSGVTWADIAAFRTWDYRVGLQAITTGGDVYELFSQYEGIAKHGAEHINLDASVQSALIPIVERPAQESEHLSLGVTAAQGPYGGLYRTGAAQIAAAQNIDDGNGDFGKAAVFTFDRHLNAASVAADPGAFRIVDAGSNTFAAQTAQLRADGLTVDLTFLDFNAASGTCSAQYVPGTVHSMADVALTATSFSFTPTGLVPPGVAFPALSAAANDGADQIVLTFDKALTGSLTGAAPHFSVGLSVYTFVPGGVLEAAVRAVAAVSAGETADELILTLTPGNRTDLQPAVGAVTVSYDGLGPLQGEGGPVQPFTASFTPASVTWKPDVAELEHIELALTATGTLTQITNRLTQDAEHIELSVTAIGTLTHVNDL